MFNRINRSGNWWLFLMPFTLSLFGLLMIYEASSIMAIEFFNNRLYFFNKQAVWLFLSVLCFFIVSRVELNKIKKYSVHILLCCILLLVLVLIPGIGQQILGGRRWLNIGGIFVQPSEITKIGFSLYLATLLTKKTNGRVFGSLILVVGGLIMLEPDMGTTVIVIGLAGIMYFISGVEKKEIFRLFSYGVFAFMTMILISPYRMSRLKTYLQPSTDIQGSSYHLNQVLMALGSGGWLGQGLGMSKQKYLYIPEVTTDSIFAIVAEEFGFLGVSAIIAIFGYYFYRCYASIIHQDDNFLLLFGTGLLSSIALQVIINLGAMSALVPLTGIPLPFISYGGTALLINFTSAGLIYNISRNKTK